MTTRAEHLAWCKERALEYVDAGDVALTLSSMQSDMNKHRETAGNVDVLNGTVLAMEGRLSTPAELRAWVGGIQ